MNKYDLHIHTKECDKCAELSGGEIVRLYKDAGYDGIVVTDHYFSLFLSGSKMRFLCQITKKLSRGISEGIILLKTKAKKSVKVVIMLRHT